MKFLKLVVEIITTTSMSLLLSLGRWTWLESPTVLVASADPVASAGVHLSRKRLFLLRIFTMHVRINAVVSEGLGTTSMIMRDTLLTKRMDSDQVRLPREVTVEIVQIPPVSLVLEDMDATSLVPVLIGSRAETYH